MFALAWPRNIFSSLLKIVVVIPPFHFFINAPEATLQVRGIDDLKREWGDRQQNVEIGCVEMSFFSYLAQDLVEKFTLLYFCNFAAFISINLISINKNLCKYEPLIG